MNKIHEHRSDGMFDVEIEDINESEIQIKVINDKMDEPEKIDAITIHVADFYDFADAVAKAMETIHKKKCAYHNLICYKNYKCDGCEHDELGVGFPFKIQDYLNGHCKL